MSDHIPSHNRYANGCRCDGCREMHRAYTATRRTAALEAGTLSHGRDSTYAAGCRCEKCYGAHQVKYYTGPSEYQPQRRRTPRLWRDRYPADTG